MNLTALPSIDADGAAVADAVLLDVREYEEWMSRHALTAVHIPMSQLVGRVEELGCSQRIICICRSGNRSAPVTAWLRNQGFDAVNMTGGMTSWASDGHPMINHAGNPGIVI